MPSFCQRYVFNLQRHKKEKRKIKNKSLSGTLTLQLSCFSRACPSIPVSGPEFPSRALAEQLCSSQKTSLEQRNAVLEKISICRLTAAAVCNKSRQLIKENSRQSCLNSSSWTENHLSGIHTKKICTLSSSGYSTRFARVPEQAALLTC